MTDASAAPALERTPERLAELADYVRTVRDVLCLATWRIDVQHREVEDADSYLAMIDPLTGTWTARLSVADSYWAREPEDQRRTVTHELMHLYHRGVTDLIDNGTAVKELMGIPAYAVLQEALKREAELMTDRLTSLLAPHMPLPATGDEEHVDALMRRSEAFE